jgi:hypothetical protein
MSFDLSDFTHNEDGENLLFQYGFEAAGSAVTFLVPGPAGVASALFYGSIGHYLTQSSDGEYTFREAVHSNANLAGGMAGAAIATSLATVSVPTTVSGASVGLGGFTISGATVYVGAAGLVGGAVGALVVGGTAVAFYDLVQDVRNLADPDGGYNGANLVARDYGGGGLVPKDQSEPPLVCRRLITSSHATISNVLNCA